jgi:hypothetical protein
MNGVDCARSILDKILYEVGVSPFVNVKVKLSLYLTKTYPLLNQAPCHEDVWGSGGVTSVILNLSTR